MSYRRHRMGDAIGWRIGMAWCLTSRCWWTDMVKIANPDGLCRIIKDVCGLAVTRSNYIMLAFAGRPPEGWRDGPLPEGVEDELPPEIQFRERRRRLRLTQADRTWLRACGIYAGKDKRR